MAIARMSRLRLVGLKSERNLIMNELCKSGAFEVVNGAPEKHAEHDRTHLDKAFARKAKVSFAIDYLYKCAEESGSELAKGKESGRKIIGFDDFYDVAAKEYELITVCDEIEKLNFARLEYKSALQKLAHKKRATEPYASFPLAFSSLGDGANVSVMLAYCAAAKEISFDFPYFAENYPTASGTLIGIIVRFCDKERAVSALAAWGFTLCELREDGTASELLSEYEREEKELAAKDEKAVSVVLGYCKYLGELKVLYDVISQDIEKSEAYLGFVTTESAFVAEGWVPTARVDKVVESVKKKTEKVVAFSQEAQEGEAPPTLIVSKKILKPYEDVTDMYSVPAYGEIDPNPFMAVFFFVFFGIMIGDAGYGVILSLASLIILKCVRLEKGTARLLALVGMGGVSAIIWGVLFGGLFSIENIPPLWFNPTKEPLMMLGVSIVLGVVQLLTGYALDSAKKFRAHKPLDAILDSVFIFVLFGGIACMALDMLIEVSAPLTEIGLGLLVLSLVGILLTAGRHNKGILSKIMGGFSGLYGLVNLLSDVLSYARLFGLGLASGAIGMAFNTLGSMFFSVPVVGYAIGIIVLIPLHAFNLGIGVLGAYVHNARLQFLEFYGKFYEGGGRAFSPLGEKTKYVRFS